MKHYTIKIYEKPPRGKFLRYEGVEAENKKDLKEKVAAWNAAHKDEYMPISTAFRLGDR